MDMEGRRGLLWSLVFVLLAVGFGKEDIQKVQFEAAFQGRCGHGSPCEQICFELHDGMYECDCKDGFILGADGYSCAEMNFTVSTPSQEDLKLDVIYQKDAVMDALEFSFPNASASSDSNEIPQTLANMTATTASDRINFTTVGPRLEQKLTSDSSALLKSTLPISTARPCTLDCGAGGGCHIENDEEPAKCLCPLGRSGIGCTKEMEIQSPRFTGSSWLAFPALKGAYKHVQLSLELRPEAYDGIFFLTGERDDMAGDFMALLLHQGFVEFRFDCGSGIGVVRSDETILLNQWNHVTLYRHRWDAWLQLNNGKHIQGRSKGLFSRITFREPLFIGGPGNTTGLDEKLPVTRGLRGCIRHLEVNDHVYKFALDPSGEAIKGFGIEECTADRCSRVPCQHGGKCLTSETSAVCLCPLGFSGDLCEIRVDLQVPSFNGSSHLRYRGLAESALTWLDLAITFKPTTPDGLIIYNGHRMDGTGDFMGLYLNDGFVEFAYDLGTGAAIVRSHDRVELSEWHEVRLSRTGRLAILTVDNQLPVEILAPGAFTQLSLPQNLYLGGVPNFGVVSPQVRVRSAFVGCIQKVQINGRSVAILAEALGGANVDNCPHPCVARPCGEDGECIPEMDYFTCRCKPGYRDHLCSRGPPSFRGTDSFFHLKDATTMEAISTDPLDINVRFKSSSESGLLLWAFTGSGFVSLGLRRGALELRFSSRYREEEMLVVHNSSTVHDGLWHRVKAVRDGSTGLLIVDNGPAITQQSVQIRPPNKPFGPPDVEGLFIGGMLHRLIGPVTGYRSGIRGCIADLVINADYHLGVINQSAIRHNIGECEV
ncbi:EGF like, fibronectin type III and laminin G domains protein pikachurin [Rhynchophorus ferrugineus]|uniref:EGF like, fibronectin type III and laminin G domains protein pikachurin n=1 Tax=Rhynchophorus ferrugineus TaxID=354439 RepID=UPI003FCE2963